jgi:hypothetical protein
MIYSHLNARMIPHEHLRDHAFHAFMSLISRTIAHAFPLRAAPDSRNVKPL